MLLITIQKEPITIIGGQGYWKRLIHVIAGLRSQFWKKERENLVLILRDHRKYGISSFLKGRGNRPAGKYEHEEKPRFPKGGATITAVKHESKGGSSKGFAQNKNRSGRPKRFAQSFHTHLMK